MNLIDNILSYASDSKKIALAAYAPSSESDPTLAYIVAMTSLQFLLEKGYAPITTESHHSNNSASHAPSMFPTLIAAPEKINKTLEGHFENIKDNFGSIETIIAELEEKAAFFLGLRDTNENTHHITGEEWKEFEGKFVNSTKRIIDTVKLIRESVKKLRSLLSQSMKYPPLDAIEKYCDNLIDTMPDPSSKWNVENATYDGLKWLHKSINGSEFTIFFRWETWFKGIKNPVGLLEMVLDKNTSQKDGYLGHISNGLDSVEELLANVGKYSRMLEREEILKHFNSLSTEKAYMYLITTVLPTLQNESTASLEEQGNTMKLISGIYDKWNSIQDIINKAVKQNQQGAAAADELGNQIKKITQDIQHQLKRARMYLPASAHSLLDTMKELSDKLITEYPKDFFTVAQDSDQTKFKAYIDNLGQGITALTSISNMTQQKLQIDTQYYNSLLGFQKSSQDSVNKTIQAALNNMRA